MLVSIYILSSVKKNGKQLEQPELHMVDIKNCSGEALALFLRLWPEVQRCQGPQSVPDQNKNYIEEDVDHDARRRAIIFAIVKVTIIILVLHLGQTSSSLQNQ